MTSRGAVTGSWTVAMAGVGLLLLVDVLRVWLPSVIFVFGRAGSTPATEMGAFAVVWFLLGLLAALLVRWLGPAQTLLGAAGILTAARLLLQIGPGGGSGQLYAACVALVAGIVWLGALVAGADSPRDVGLGLAAGMAASVTLHTALDTVDLTWRGRSTDGVLALIAVGILLLLFVVTAARAVRDGEVGGQGGGGPAWPWLAVGPAVVLVGVLSGVTARAEIATGIGAPAAGALLAAAHAAGVAAAASAQRSSTRAAGPVVAVALLAGTGLSIPASGAWAVAGQVVLALGVGGLLGLAGAAGGRATATARAVTAAAGMLVFFLFGFLYYAAYDISFGVDNQVVLLAAAVVAAGLSLRMRPVPRPLAPARGWGFATAVAAAALLAAIGMDATPGEATASGDGFPVRVMTYNIHMGFDTAGRFDAAALAQAVRAVDPDILVLNEVDRGWLLNGGHDTMDLLSRELDMPYRFGPAADRVWGNAVLSRLPMSEATITALPREGAPMRRSAISVVVDLGGGRELGIVGTHLHHLDDDADVRLAQAGVVAVTAAQLHTDARPVAVLGDLNAGPGTPELAPLREILVDALAHARPVRTFPSWDPDEEIDHVFVTPELTGEAVVVPGTEASDHLGVGVTLVPAGSE